MEPLHALYLILFISSSVYFVFLKSNVGGFSVALGGVSFYFLPALLGKGEGVSGLYTIDPVVYLFSCLFIFALVVGDRVLPRVQFKFQTEERATGPVHTRILTALTVIFVILMLVQQDLSVIGAAKADISPPITVNVLRYLIPISFIAAWVHRDWKFLTPIGISLVIFTVLYQVRSPAAITLIGVFLYELNSRDLDVLGRLRTVVLALSGGLLILLFDKVKGRLLSGEVSVLFEFERAVNQVIWNNNSHIIFEILNRVASRGYRIPDPGTHFVLNFLNIVPFGETLFDIPTAKFSVIIKPALFPERSAGVGSNIWAEAYAIGGVFGLIFALFIFLTVLAILSAQLNSESWSLRIFSLSLVPYWAFFNHRLTFGAILTTGTITGIICFGPVATVYFYRYLLKDKMGDG